METNRKQDSMRETTLQPSGTGFQTLEWKEFFGSSVSLTSDWIFTDVSSSSINQPEKITTSQLGDAIAGWEWDASSYRSGKNVGSLKQPLQTPIVITDRNETFVGNTATTADFSGNFPSSSDCGNVAPSSGDLTNDDRLYEQLGCQGSSQNCVDGKSKLVRIDGEPKRFGLPTATGAMDLLQSSSLTSSDELRKRPLSVSSTSSTSLASASSSLSRHQSKKMATTCRYSGGADDLGLEEFVSEASATDSAAAGGLLSTVVEQADPALTFSLRAAASAADRDDDDDDISRLIKTDVSSVSVAESLRWLNEDDDDGRCESDEETDVTVEPDSSSSVAAAAGDATASPKGCTLPRDCNASAVSGSGSPTSTGLLRQVLSPSQYVTFVIAEIMDTERAYIADLRQIIEGYLNHIRTTSSRYELSADDVSTLFGNIESIFDFNRGLMSSLERSSNDPVQIANCFVQHSDGFVVYSDYCTNYPRSVEILTKYMKDPEVSAMLKRQQLALQHGLPLGSYLLKPVQRILKYHVMLQNLLNNHDVLEPGHVTIEMAVERMVNVGRLINEMKRRHEKAVHVQEIQSRLYGWDGADLTTLGDLVLDDKFRLCGAKAHRHIFLFDKAILAAKRKTDGILIVKAFIMCSNLMLVESIPKEPLAFQIIPFDSPRLQYTIQANGIEQKRLWCQQIKRLILDNYSVTIPDKAKELVMMLGSSCRDDIELDDRGKRQHEAPEYLEKRHNRGRRKSTGLIGLSELKLIARNGLRRSEPSTVLSSTRKPSHDECLVEEDEPVSQLRSGADKLSTRQSKRDSQKRRGTVAVDSFRQNCNKGGVTPAVTSSSSAEHVEPDSNGKQIATETPAAVDLLADINAANVDIENQHQSSTDASTGEGNDSKTVADGCLPHDSKEGNFVDIAGTPELTPGSQLPQSENVPVTLDPWQPQQQNKGRFSKRFRHRFRLHQHNSKTCPTCGHPEGIDRNLEPASWHSAANVGNRSSCGKATSGRHGINSCRHCVTMSPTNNQLTSTPRCLESALSASTLQQPSTSLPDGHRERRRCHSMVNKTSSLSDVPNAADFDVDDASVVLCRPHSSSLIDQLSLIRGIDDDGDAGDRRQRHSCISDDLPESIAGDICDSVADSTSELFQEQHSRSLMVTLKGAVVHLASALKDHHHSGSGTAAPCRPLFASSSSVESSLSADSDRTVSTSGSSTAAAGCCSSKFVSGGRPDVWFATTGHHHHHNHYRRHPFHLSSFISRQQRRFDSIRHRGRLSEQSEAADAVTSSSAAGGLLAVDAVRRGLTNLMRTNEQQPTATTGNSVVGQRIATSSSIGTNSRVEKRRATNRQMREVVDNEKADESERQPFLTDDNPSAVDNNRSETAPRPVTTHEDLLEAALESLDENAGDDDDVDARQRLQQLRIVRKKNCSPDYMAESFYETVLSDALDSDHIDRPSSPDSVASLTYDLGCDQCLDCGAVKFSTPTTEAASCFPADDTDSAAQHAKCNGSRVPIDADGDHSRDDPDVEEDRVRTELEYMDKSNQPRRLSQQTDVESELRRRVVARELADCAALARSGHSLGTSCALSTHSLGGATNDNSDDVTALAVTKRISLSM